MNDCIQNGLWSPCRPTVQNKATGVYARKGHQIIKKKLFRLTYTMRVNSQRNKSRDSTGSHGVPAGEADNNNFWDLQTKASRESLRKAKINTVQEKET